jgi:tRNA G18 (ribose-2'-O)-methylase SpoU
VRAASCFGARTLVWTGDRVYEKSGRLPREERMASYSKRVSWKRDESPRPLSAFRGCTPVCIELLPGAEPLWTFRHPERAVYVFGPEDGDVPKGIRHACHSFVSIPTEGQCLNLAAAVNVVLAHRAWQASPEQCLLMAAADATS